MANQKEAELTDQSCGSTVPSSLLQSLKQGTSSEPKRHSNVKLPPLTMITSQVRYFATQKLMDCRSGVQRTLIIL